MKNFYLHTYRDGKRRPGVFEHGLVSVVTRYVEDYYKSRQKPVPVVENRRMLLPREHAFDTIVENSAVVADAVWVPTGRVVQQIADTLEKNLKKAKDRGHPEWVWYIGREWRWALTRKTAEKIIEEIRSWR